MKKERNCGCGGNYPVYPAYQPIYQDMMSQGMMPQSMMGMYTGQMQTTMPNQPFGIQTGTTIEQQLSTINSQINSLERRINNLESLIGNQTKYNNSNYQIM